MTMMGNLLISDPKPGVRLITLNRPEVHNAIDMALAANLAEALTLAQHDTRVRCLVITGAGDKAFSSGFDIKEMAGFETSAIFQAFIQRDPLMLKIAVHPLPIIAALNGLAHGAGALIAVACDFRIACQHSEFRVTAINYGSANATWSLPRLVGAARAKDIIMTGRCVGPEEGMEIRLYDRLCEASAIVDEAIAMAEHIATKPRDAIIAAKRLVDQSSATKLTEAWEAEHQHVLEMLDAHHSSGGEIFANFLHERSQR